MTQVQKKEPSGGDEAEPQAPADMQRLLEGAGDALTDDMVTRLSATLAEGVDLLDRFNRSGIADALPVLAGMVKSGDLERAAGVMRLVGSAQDALSDDIVSRMAQTATDGLDLLDRVNRSDVADALPAITALVRNGDLDRLVGLARLVGSAQDALSDDIISRLALIAGELMCLVDRVARNSNLLRILDLLGRDDVQKALAGALDGLVAACEEVAEQPPAKGGLGALLALGRDAKTQEGLRFVAALGSGMRSGQ